MADATPRSLWLDRLDTNLASAADEPPRSVDLLVVGGGLTGLWAAAEAAAVGRAVAVVDGGVIGAGASGKCGGFVNASITHGIVNGHARWPAEMPTIVALQQAMWDDTLRLLDELGDGDLIEPCGKLTVATRQHLVASLDTSIDVLRAYGQDVRRLDADATRDLVRSPTYLGGYHHADANGLCDPVRLVRALARLAARRGVALVEGRRVTRLRAVGAGVEVEGADGQRLRAGRVLLATNADRPLLRRLRRRVIPVYDHVIATAPLTSTQWAALGWRERQGITDAGNQFHYYRPTPDGRILFGGWNASYHFGSAVDERLERRHRTHRLLAEHLVSTFPQLDGIEISHAWGGAIDSTSRFTPTFGTALGGTVSWAVGFTGLGVGASRFAALTALDLLEDRHTDRTDLTMVKRSPIPFPPEPLRWLTVQFTKRALLRDDATGVRGRWLRLLDRFGVGFDT